MTNTNDLCNICPRRCGEARGGTSGAGVCGMGRDPVVARAMLHQWEEPCVSGENGSGTVFFSGCALNCVYCQNSDISLKRFGKPVTVARLREIYGELIAQGAHNINLVNPTHFSDCILASLEGGLPVPVVWNSGGYERVETLRRLEGKIQIYLPDMKYALRPPAGQYSSAADYPETARRAILEMFRQTGPYLINDDGLLTCGVIIRHLILPENLENTRRVIDWVSETFKPGDVLFSLMSQYTPCGALDDFPELRRRLTQEEYDEAVGYLEASGIEDGFFQELSSAKEEYIPEFDLRGV
ncbi:putative pyruvate formate lyase activating enzyme [Sporobacter termitidis DSM 10068]|uniref:Putative pyruvate formate lyase activating enzyme n=1 Tax=Sporobacter termitidis DSM 10068 TaxID=1123282 RepID=A0A1M5UPB2_9FIRM|nr:4Fe-4S cluster-binding domain-containing protein [Sporobacter termitidis]SHH64736.1 putative pyruvate formate lyase activating enzyme [Sporobacter termitidis DSM 10068]